MEWEKLKKKMKEHLLSKRGSGRVLRMRKALNVPDSSFSNWLNGKTIPNYDKGMMIKKYLKNPVPDPVKKKETHYEMLKRTNQIIKI